MNQQFQDTIALAWYYHSFNLFLTFMCNSQWPEITQALLPRQTPSDHPNIIVRVFQMAILFTLDLTTAAVIKYAISLQTTGGLFHTIQTFCPGLIILFIVTLI
jgi:hypothetical protein